MPVRFTYPILVLAALVLSACVDTAGAASGNSVGTAQNNPTSQLPGQPQPTGAPRSYQTDVLLFTGAGTWSSEVVSIKDILSSHGATYQEVSSSELDAMTPAQLATFGLMLFPGGEGGTEAGSLSAQTHANLRAAVQQQGVSYIGFCAGSFIAEAPAPAAGQDVSYGLGVVNGPVLDLYYLGNQGVTYQMTPYTFPDGSTEDILWYGGPVTPNTGVIAKYPSGEPAISEMWSGNGFVVLSGGHPTASQAILDALGMTSTDGTHLDLAWKLINAALHQQPLPMF